jgi:glycosyltransferase involved in cell wall biosynthesis
MNPSKSCVFLMTNSLETGGSERQFASIARSLNRDAFRVELGCLKRKGAFLEGLGGEIAEFHLDGSFFNSRARRASLELARHLRANATDIVHSFDFYSNMMLIPTAKWTHIPVVIGSQRQIGDRLTRFQSAAQAIAFRMCDQVVCNSRAAADRLTRQGLSKAKITIIPNGLPKLAFDSVPAVLRRQPGQVRIAYVARMNDSVKNHCGFLKAAARLAYRCPSVEFVFVGDGPLRSGLEKLASDLGLEGRVRFLGERHDMAAILASVDVSVLFSFSESMPNVILEAMAAGVPVVASRVGGNPEVVRDKVTGLLVKAGDEEELVEALATLVEQPQLRLEYGQRGKRLAEEEFQMERIARLYEELYKSLLEEKCGRAERNHPSRLSVASISNRPLRVAIVAASPRWMGGHGVQANLLMRHWQDEPGVDGRFIPIDPPMPRFLERMPFIRTLVRTPIYLTALWRGIADVDIVHIFSASYWSFLLAPMPAWLVARVRGKKTLIHYHSGEARDHLGRSRIACRVLRAADRIVVPSPYLVDVFKDFDLRAQAVPNIVDEARLSYHSRTPLRPRLVCTRGFHPYYSVDAVVRAFRLVKNNFPEARLCLLGNGSMETEIRSLVNKLELADVEYIGAVPHKEIWRYYQENDIFINASWVDNMPVSILEAFAVGTPVVTTAPESIRYLVEHERTGLLCETRDWKALGENVIRLLRDPNLALHIAQNAHKECERYRWEQVRSQWLQVYRSMCSLKYESGGEFEQSLPPPQRPEGFGLGSKQF